MEIDLAWSDHYLIGVDEVDVQHKRLLLVMQRVFALKEQDLAAPDLLAALDELKRYADFHLKSEELLMKVYGYPGYDAQHQEHEEIYAELTHRIKRAGSGNDLSELLYFLIEWFVGHTRGKDREMGRYIAAMRNPPPLG